ADEWRWSAGRPVIGTTVLGSLGGVQPHLQRSPCLLLSPTGPFDVDAAGAPAQDRGEVIGLSVAWGGNSHVSLDLRARAEPGAPGELRVRAGANALGAPYRLDPGTRM